MPRVDMWLGKAVSGVINKRVRNLPCLCATTRHVHVPEIKMHMHLQISGSALGGDDGRMKGSDKCLKAGFKARWHPSAH
jgi:hypothetical protein